MSARRFPATGSRFHSFPFTLYSLKYSPGRATAADLIGSSQHHQELTNGHESGSGVRYLGGRGNGDHGPGEWETESKRALQMNHQAGQHQAKISEEKSASPAAAWEGEH